MKSPLPVWLCAIVALSIGAFSASAADQADDGEPDQSPRQAQESDDLVDAGSPGADNQPPATACRCLGDGDTVARIKQALAQPLKSGGLDFSQQPLEHIVNFIREQYNIPILIDTAALEDSGLTADEPVTVQVHGVTLKSALRWALGNLNLTYLISNEMVIVTTPEVAEEDLATCVYDVRDLASDSRSINALMDAITSCIAPETWAEAGGGEAEIRPLQPGLLVVSQTSLIQDEIAELLVALRELRHRAPKKAIRHASEEKSAREPTPAEEPLGH